MLKETQEHHDAQRKAMQYSVVDANAQMAKEKRDRDDNEKREKMADAAHEVEFTLTHDFMTENQ